ncbi:hypothetical protein K469DRAFT_35392 [Zopfia rhizophila CBS 207.26]|uniref:Uncharacterized protein n=1 Tax=Zopfia rhizophila CBS 207.26 TaxID=1314779 RepID=A0A6A6DCU3_9PEZI|nr:hypothetical protein K469DRAFT_35392 [Zopfia rhizophila CBS 207.26]
MKKVGSTNAPGTSGSGCTHTAVGGVPMRRAGSGGSGASRTPSSLSVRPRDSPIPRGDTSTPAPSLSRTPSTNTITQSRAHPQATSVRNPLQHSVRAALINPRRLSQAPPVSPPKDSRAPALDLDSPDTGASSSSSSSSDSDTDNPVHRSQLFKRPPRFRTPKTREFLAYDDAPFGLDEEPEPSTNVTLPFANAPVATPVGHSSNMNVKRESAANFHGEGQGNILPSVQHHIHAENKAFGRSSNPLPKTANEKIVDASSSIASSASDVPKTSTVAFGPLSPKHRAELAKLSPRRSGIKGKRDGSEGTPSMGSSFSDIDDASITQSALEEALLSNMQHGRMSTLSQLRSRYL